MYVEMEEWGLEKVQILLNNHLNKKTKITDPLENWLFQFLKPNMANPYWSDLQPFKFVDPFPNLLFSFKLQTLVNENKDKNSV